MSQEFYERVAKIQRELKAPKNQHNKFGGFNYRSCEDILEALKPILNGLVLTISDDIVPCGDRVYVKATVTVTDGTNSLSNTALAREAVTKKGMDDSQITGTASSYARKYALNGLWLIDDTKDADTMDNRNHQAQTEQVPDMTAHNAAVQSNYETIGAIKEMLANDDKAGALSLWRTDISNEDKHALWVAPTKGGIFTTDERKKLKEGKA